MERLKRLLIISRPIAWVGLASFFWWGLIASGSGYGTLQILGIIYFTFPGSLLVLGINDLADSKSDVHNRRKGALDGAIVQSHERRVILLASLLPFMVFLAMLFVFQRYLSFAATSLIGLFAYTYSVKPVRLKNIPIIDSLSNGSWVCMIFLTAYYLDRTSISFGLAPTAYLAVFFVSFTALHALATLIDYNADKKAGDMTIGIFLGKRVTSLIALILFTMAAIISVNLNWVLFLFYLFCTGLSFIVVMRPDYLILEKVKNIFYAVSLIPLPLVYLISK